MVCIICQQQVEEDIFYHPDNICSNCYRDEVETLIGYDPLK